MKTRGYWILAALILTASVSAFAHNGDGDSLPGGPGSSGINAGGGAMIELADEKSVQFLIAVSYPGVEGESAREDNAFRYFAVSAQTMLATEAAHEGSVLTALGLNIVPISRIMASRPGVISSWRFFPTDVRRELHSGMRSSVSASVIGWTRYGESAIGQEPPSEEELAKVIKFAQIAVDMVGLRFANLVEHGRFMGSQLASTQMLAGLGWNINQRVSLRISIGGRGAYSLGRADDGLGMMIESGVSSRVQMFLNTAHAILNSYLEVGYHRLDVAGRGFGDEDEGHHDEHPNHGHLYLMVGAGAAF